MTYADLQEVCEIENKSFTMPWSLYSFKYELSHEDAIMEAALLEGRIIGYICMRVIFNAAHILNIAVLPEFRRLGVGSALLQSALKKLGELRPDIDTITLEVRESGITAIRFYEKFGFMATGRRRHYYQSPKEDAIIMEKKFG
ncbi:MAG: ribosomal protein S18-alanine N-acetyltransferase [Nitrospirae bacterium]|nr:ribosomal protein S18-alanine N-acetyltransferase [Nitrospirota bacterium]